MTNETIDIRDKNVTFETAQLLKANDFHVKFCPGVYDDAGKLRFFYRRKSYDWNINQLKFSAPTQSQAMTWLRIVHGLFIVFDNDDLDYCWCVLDINDRDENHDPKQVTESFAGYFQLEDAAEYSVEVYKYVGNNWYKLAEIFVDRNNGYAAITDLVGGGYVFRVVARNRGGDELARSAGIVSGSKAAE